MADNKPKTRSNSSSQVNPTMEDKIDLLLKEVGQIKASNSQFLKEMADIKEELRIFKTDVNSSIELCFNKIDDCMKTVVEDSKLLNVCQDKIEALESDNRRLTAAVKEMKKKLDVAEQYSRSNCLDIQGVPEAKEENIVTIVKQVAAACNFKLEDHMIDTVHRLSKNPNKPQEPRGIILKFCRRLDMEEMRRKSRVKRSLSAADLGFASEKRIYVNLSLTKETRLLWSEVQAFKKRRMYKYAWITSAGKIFLRKKEGDSACFITEKSDLDRLK